MLGTLKNLNAVSRLETAAASAKDNLEKVKGMKESAPSIMNASRLAFALALLTLSASRASL